jgi:hypothetical protein
MVTLVVHTSMTRFQVMVSGSMSNLANLAFSSSVSSLGSVFLIPSFSNLRYMIFANCLLPSLSDMNDVSECSMWAANQRDTGG